MPRRCYFGSGLGGDSGGVVSDVPGGAPGQPQAGQSTNHLYYHHRVGGAHTVHAATGSDHGAGGAIVSVTGLGLREGATGYRKEKKSAEKIKTPVVRPGFFI
jgi:hypothetical protein